MIPECAVETTQSYLGEQRRRVGVLVVPLGGGGGGELGVFAQDHAEIVRRGHLRTARRVNFMGWLCEVSAIADLITHGDLFIDEPLEAHEQQQLDHRQLLERRRGVRERKARHR